MENNPLISLDDLEALHHEAFCWALLKCNFDQELAADVIQNTYLKLLSGKAEFQGKSTLKTWLFAVVRNTALEELRRSGRRTTLLQKISSITKSETIADLENEVIDKESALQIRECIQKLSEKQRDVLLLVLYHDFSVEQAAQCLGITLGAARVHYHRGKNRMRTLLGDLIDED